MRREPPIIRVRLGIGALCPTGRDGSANGASGAEPQLPPQTYRWRTVVRQGRKGAKLRAARRAWRDYYRHPFARRHNADPSTEGLADQQRERKTREKDWRREEQERARDHEFWASKARDLSAWAPKGMG